MSGVRSWVSCVPDGEGAIVRKPGTATSIRASLGSLALITCFRALEVFGDGVETKDHAKLTIFVKKDF